MTTRLLFLFLLIALVTCTKKTAELKPGVWRGVIQMQD